MAHFHNRHSSHKNAERHPAMGWRSWYPDLITRCEHRCTYLCREFCLRFRNLTDINISDDADLNIFTYAKHNGRIFPLTAKSHDIVVIKENIYLIALARMHGVSHNA